MIDTTIRIYVLRTAWLVPWSTARNQAHSAARCVAAGRSRSLAGLSACLLVLLLAACSSPTRLAPPPADQTDNIQVLGIPNARFWVDNGMDALVKEAVLSAQREADAVPPGPHGERPPASFLAVSGGGDNGAFGAGLLVGWTAHGDRPNFKLVTGVSTGGLTAPFAFLGPAYDDELRAVFTDVTQKDIFTERSILAAVTNDAMSDSAPLFTLISRYANDKMMADIAREYKKGRLLLIGTTDIDVQRPVMWNIGAIAASGKPGALDLIRRILRASSAIPGAFPPVMIDVEVNGHHYQEMHVDGGAVAQTFLYPVSFRLQAQARALGVERERTAYIIRNGRLDPDWADTERNTMSIAGRAIATMIHYSGVNDIVRIYATTQRDNVGYRLAYIPKSFNAEHKAQFDQKYMRALFDLAYQKARNGYPWLTAPPGLGPAPAKAGPSVAETQLRRPRARAGGDIAGSGGSR